MPLVRKRPAAALQRPAAAVAPPVTGCGWVWSFKSATLSEVRITYRQSLSSDSAWSRLIGALRVDERRSTACRLENLQRDESVSESMYSRLISGEPVTVDSAESSYTMIVEYCKSCEFVYLANAREDCACVVCGD